MSGTGYNDDRAGGPDLVDAHVVILDRAGRRHAVHHQGRRRLAELGQADPGHGVGGRRELQDEALAVVLDERCLDKPGVGRDRDLRLGDGARLGLDGERRVPRGGGVDPKESARDGRALCGSRHYTTQPLVDLYGGCTWWC